MTGRGSMNKGVGQGCQLWRREGEGVTHCEFYSGVEFVDSINELM